MQPGTRIRALDCTYETHPFAVVPIYLSHVQLGLAGARDGGRVLVLDSACVAATGLDGSDDAHRLGVALWDLAEDNVLAVEP